MLCEKKGAAGALEITGKPVRAYRYGAGGVWGGKTHRRGQQPVTDHTVPDTQVIRRRSLRGRSAGANGVRVAEAGPAMAPSHPRPSTDLSGTAASRQVRYGTVRLHSPAGSLGLDALEQAPRASTGIDNNRTGLRTA